MELTMAAQADSTPWDLPPPLSPSTESSTGPEDPVTLHGRGYFSALGAVRRKPSRPDAPPTLSKSCSDKIALKQSTSLLSSITSLLISPSNAYIHSLILPSSQHSSVACKRAFSDSGRLSDLKGRKWAGGYAFHVFNILTTEHEFSHSRRQSLKDGEKIAPSNTATSWTPNHNETLIGGTLQGRKQFSLKGASRVCKRRNWKLALKIASLVTLRAPSIERCLSVESYRTVKEGGMLAGRRAVKLDVRTGALKGWVKNQGGEDFNTAGVDV